MLKHPRAMHYNRLIALTLLANLALLGYGLTRGGWWSSHGVALKEIAVAAQANLAFAIIMRQQYLINALSWLATRAPTTWPLRIRWALAKVYHIGGLHVGSAVSGMLWYLALTGSLFFAASREQVPAANVALSCVVAALLVVMIVLALPKLRARFHDRFEVTHRFCGLGALVGGWLNTVVLAASHRGSPSMAGALLATPTLWILLLSTASGMVSWVRLRKVPITVERPSSHAAIVSFDHGLTPLVGSARAISRNPLSGWHYFANVPAPVASRSGYRMVVSRAGDWTGKFIDNPPSHVWIRGIPTAGMANVRKLFTRVVYVATGSGIGPMLAHLLVNEVPAHLVWVTRSPRETYGDMLVDEILAAQPGATIWNTDLLGKPDMLGLAYAAYAAAGAEVVICIANKRVTWQIVHGLERLGIPAFGPIWDS
jgi:hypothetical protein